MVIKPHYKFMTISRMFLITPQPPPRGGSLTTFPDDCYFNPDAPHYDGDKPNGGCKGDDCCHLYSAEEPCEGCMICKNNYQFFRELKGLA